MFAGEIRRPTNRTYQERGSIHDDATAQRLGFRGGTIAAATHLDQFPPVLVSVFGAEWFETGCLSLYFRHATVDGEPVQVLLADPPVQREAGAQCAASMVTPDSTIVAEGTASVGTVDEPSALYLRDLRHDPSGLRILSALSVDMEIDCAPARVDGQLQRARLSDGLISEPLDWYGQSSPWGGQIATPSAIVGLFTEAAASALLPRIRSAVGMWGAIEVRHHREPLFTDHDYVLTGSVVALGSSPKTEILWYDMSAADSHGVVASMRILTRFVKASSTLYEGADESPAQ